MHSRSTLMLQLILRVHRQHYALCCDCRSSDVIEASLTDTQRRVSLTPRGSSNSAGRRGKGIGQGNVTRTRNIGYILILAGGGGLASQSPLKGSPALERVHYLDLQEGGKKCSFRDELQDYDRLSAHIAMLHLKISAETQMVSVRSSLLLQANTVHADTFKSCWQATEPHFSEVLIIKPKKVLLYHMISGRKNPSNCFQNTTKMQPACKLKYAQEVHYTFFESLVGKVCNVFK